MEVREKKTFKPTLNELGQEVPDPTPVAATITMRPPVSLEQRIASMVIGRQAYIERYAGEETFDEANDFGTMDPEDALFEDESDDIYAVNDPNLERAVENERQRVAERVARLRKFKEETAAQRRTNQSQTDASVGDPKAPK